MAAVRVEADSVGILLRSLMPHGVERDRFSGFGFDLVGRIAVEQHSLAARRQRPAEEEAAVFGKTIGIQSIGHVEP